MRTREGIFWEVVIILISLPGSIYLNKFLGAEQRGYLAAIMIIPTFIGTLISCQWDKVIRKKILENINCLAEIGWKTKYYLFGMSIAGISLSIILILIQNNLDSIQKNQAIFASIFLIPLSLTGLFIIAILNSIHKQREYYCLRIIGPVIFLVTILAWSQTNININKVIISYILMWSSIVLVGLYYLSGRINNYENQYKLETKNLSKGFGPFLIETTSVQIDIWLLSNYVGNAVTGAYAAYKILETPFKVISFGYINIGSIKSQNIEKIKYQIILSLLILLTIGIFLILSVYFYGELVVGAFIGESYNEYISIAYYIIINGIVSSIAGILMNIINLKYNINYYYKIQTFDGLSKIILMSFATIIYGLIGLVIVMILSNMLKSIYLVKIIFSNTN